MAQSALAILSSLGAARFGVFRGAAALEQGVTRRQLDTLRAHGVVERVLPDTFRLTAVRESDEQLLWAAALWAGDPAVASGRSAGALYGLEGVRAPRPELAVPRSFRGRAPVVTLQRVTDLSALMPRHVQGLRVTGVEPTLVRLAHVLDAESFEIACEDARRRRLTSVPALRAYLDRYGRPGQRGVATFRAQLDQLDPVHASRSTLEVRARRLLVAHGLTDFVREFPLSWNGRTYFFDFAFPARRTILETNGRRWHDDVADYDHDHEKWSVPGRHGYKLVLATWDKVTRRPGALLGELSTTLAA